MGQWNCRLYTNDLSCDVKVVYIDCLKNGDSNELAYKKTYNEFVEVLGTDEESLFWYSLADTQWNVGRLMPEVREKALGYISTNDLRFLDDADSKVEEKWKQEVEKLKIKLESPMPDEKRFSQPVKFITNPWDIGDVYAYQFHTDLSKECDLFGKYILFKKVGNVKFKENGVVTLRTNVEMYNKVFNDIPSIDMVDSLPVLPFAQNLKNYPIPFETYLTATLVLLKKSHYPQNYFTYIGNIKTIENNKFSFHSEYYFEKDRMELWIVPFYLSWN